MVSSNKESIDLIEAFIDTIWMEKGLSSNTLSSYKQDLLSFSSWLPNKNLVEPYFKVHVYMALSSRDKLMQYENEFQKRNYATITT